MLLSHKTTQSIEEPTVIFFGTTLVIIGGIAGYFYWNTDNHTREPLTHTNSPTDCLPTISSQLKSQQTNPEQQLSIEKNNTTPEGGLPIKQQQSFDNTIKPLQKKSLTKKNALFIEKLAQYQRDHGY